MSKHSKNNTASAVFTYAERKMLRGYGTQVVRLGADSQNKFGTCTMYLHKLQSPMCCSQGHVFCKNCAIEHLVKQKKEQQKQLEIYEKQQKKGIEEKNDSNDDCDKKKLEQFAKLEDSFDPKTRKELLDQTSYGKSNQKSLTQKEAYELKVNQNLSLSKDQQIAQSFWMPENIKSVDKKIKKPEVNLVCPSEQKHQVKLKLLIPLNLKEISQSDGQSEYICHLCSKQLQYQKIGTSKKCGHVMCLDCIQVSVKESKNCGLCMTSCEKSDIIQLDSSHSAFAAHNSVEAKQFQNQISI